MRSKTLRTTIFTLHRWLGLLAGLVLTIVGITGSLLVFQKEWDSWLIRQQFGSVTAAKPPLEIDQLVEIVSTAYTNVKGAIPAYVSIPPNPATPYTIGFQLGEQYWDVFVNPTTGKVLGDRQWETSLVGRLYDLHIHYQAMVGRIYLESKALELIALQLHQLLANERGTIDLPALKQYEIDSPLERLRQRIHQAKDILLQQQIDPPSLMELSQQVGLYQSISSKLKVAKTLARS